jgi:hypothetical protein
VNFIHRIPPAACLSCVKTQTAAKHDGASRGPRPDDFLACIDCGYIMCFDDKLGFRVLSDEDWEALSRASMAQGLPAPSGRLN